MLYQKFKSKINLLIILMSLSWIVLVVFIGFSFMNFRNEMHLSTHGKEKLQASLFKLQAINEGQELIRLIKKNKNKEVSEYLETLKAQHEDLQLWLKSNSITSWNGMIADAQQLMTSAHSDSDIEALDSGSLKSSIEELKNIAVNNNWKRILMMADQMMMYAGKKKDPLIRSTLNSLSELLSVSTLSDEEKNLVTAKSEKITRILDNNLVKNQTISKWEDWAQQFMNQKEIVVMDLKVQLAGSEKRIENAYGSFLRNAIIGLFLAIFVMVASYLLVQRWSNDWQVKFENDLDLFLRDDIFRGKLTLKNWIREKSQKQFKRHTDFILQKLDLGREFETGVPLPCFIVNHELQITWGNDLFLEQFNINAQELGKDYLDWNFLTKYLLTGDEDPIEKTISDQVPGIYQIKIKLNESETKSYEMHVTPMTTESGEKILILFYPLAFLEESLASQIQLIANPLEHIIPKIDLVNLQDSENQQSINFWIEELKKSGQDKIYQYILDLRDRVMEQFNYSSAQVLKLNLELQDTKQMLSNLKLEASQFVEEFKKTKNISRDWGELITQTEEKIDSVKVIEKKLVKEIRHLNLGIETLKKQLIDIKSKISDAQQYLQQLNQVRKDPQDLKTIDSLIMKIQFTLNIYPTENQDVIAKDDSIPALHERILELELIKEKSLLELEKMVDVQSTLFEHAKMMNQMQKTTPADLNLLS